MRSLDRIRNEIETIIKEGGLEQTTLNFFFSRIRIVLEKENSKKNYPYLSMVCNWYQHHEITRSTIGYEIIKDVGDLIFEDISMGEKIDDQRYDKLLRNISSALRLAKLREEMAMFFISHNINSLLTDNHNWHSIMKRILYDLVDRPLLLPEIPNKPRNRLNRHQRKGKEIYDYLEEKAKKIYPDEWEMILPIGLSIEIKGSNFIWNIKMKKMVDISGALLMND